MTHYGILAYGELAVEQALQSRNDLFNKYGKDIKVTLFPGSFRTPNPTLEQLKPYLDEVDIFFAFTDRSYRIPAEIESYVIRRIFRDAERYTSED